VVALRPAVRGEQQSAVFYPPHLLFDVLPGGARVLLNMAAHLLVAAAGLRPPAGMARERRRGGLSAVTFAFGTYFVANIEFLS